MLGINDPRSGLHISCVFVSAFGCIVYGILKWNVGAKEEV